MPVEVLRIENFKSVKNLKLNCRRVNLFIGKPNSGKTNILETIGLCSHTFHGPGEIKKFVRCEVITDLFYDHILETPIRIAFDENVLQVSFKNGTFSGILLVKERGGDVFRYGYDGTGSNWSREAFSAYKFYRFKKQRLFMNQKSDFLQPPEGTNLMAVIRTRKELRRILRDLFGEFGYRPVYRPHEGMIEVLKEEPEDVLVALPYSLASETLQRLVFYLAAIYSNKESVLTFEEPEAHAFPYYTKYLAERIALDKNNNQYFITTHNPYFLVSVLEKTPSKEVTVFLTSLENYQTKVKALNEKQKEEILVDMGYDFFFNLDKFLS